MVYGSDIVTCWCYTEFYVVIMQMSWPCLILISVQDFHDLLLTQLRSPINLRSVTIRDRQEMLNVSRIRMTDALKNAWTSMAYKKKKSKGNYNSKSKILIQNIGSSMKGLLPFDNNFTSFENSTTRPDTGLLPQIFKTQNSKYRAISIICSSKRQTDWISGLMYLDLFEPQSSGTTATAWSCILKYNKSVQASKA